MSDSAQPVVCKVLKLGRHKLPYKLKTATRMVYSISKKTRLGRHCVIQTPWKKFSPYRLLLNPFPLTCIFNFHFKGNNIGTNHNFIFYCVVFLDVFCFY